MNMKKATADTRSRSSVTAASLLAISHVAVALTAFSFGFVLASPLQSSDCPPFFLETTASHRLLKEHRQDDNGNGDERKISQSSLLRSAAMNEEKNPNVLRRIPIKQESTEKCPPCPTDCHNKKEEKVFKESVTANHTKTQPASPLTHVYAGMGRVDRNDFARHFDVGVPLRPSSDGNSDVLILYDGKSLPDENNMSFGTTTTTGIQKLASVEEATSKCMAMKVIFIDPDENNHCLAIMGQWQSHYIHKWLRISEGTQHASFQQPLQMVSRSHTRDNTVMKFPIINGVKFSFNLLSSYVNRLDVALQKMRPIAQELVRGKNDNTIIVMTSNRGQSEMLINFVCSAHSRGLDTSQVLLVATDVETMELGKSLGLATFYDEQLFSLLPKETSHKFGDETFRKLVIVKLYAVHMLLTLQYNVLLQDLDVVWLQHPLEYFSFTNMKKNNIGDDFDLYFQDNGVRAPAGEPYHANSGFFLARYNKRTAYFFSTLIRQTDLIFAHDDQIAMNALLNEHASLTGLRVKTLNRDDENDGFPSGFHFHRRPTFMKKFMQGTVHPVIFHINWTGSTKEKQQCLEQMGLWFVSDQCDYVINADGEESSTRVLSNSNSEQASTTTTTTNRPAAAATAAVTITDSPVAASCCLASPIVKCHFRDKPSKIPCRDSPPRDEGKPSFW